MKRFTKISLIVCLIAILMGTAACAVGAGLGFSLGQVREWGFTRSTAELEEERGGKNWIENNYEYKADEVQSMDLELICGELVIEEVTDSSDITVSIDYRGVFKNLTRKITCSVEHNILKVDDDAKKIWNNLKNAYVTIQIPKDKTFEKITIETGAGTLKLNTNLNADNIRVDIGAGELVSEDYQINAEEELNIYVGAGSVDLEDVKAKQLKVESGVGEAHMNRVLADNIRIDCGMGDIKLGCIGVLEDFDYKIDYGIGSVSVGDSTYSGLGGSKVIQNKSDKKIEIECGVGSVDVDFTK